MVTRYVWVGVDGAAMAAPATRIAAATVANEPRTAVRRCMRIEFVMKPPNEWWKDVT